jgi:haloalkane dehalogenase
LPHTPTFRPDPELYPFRSRWFDARAGRVHYLDEGEGPVLLFLHGTPTWSFLYRGVVVRMRRRFRCIAPDYLGFGLSEHPPGFGYTPRDHAEVIRQLLHHLDLRDVTIMGHEWGGPIALRVALDETPRVRALVLGNTWYWPAEAWHMLMFAHILSSAPAQKLMLERNWFVERVLPAGCAHPMHDSVLRHYADVFPTVESRFGVAELPRQILGSSFWLGEIAHAVPRMLAGLPLLLTWGMRDLAFPPRFMDRFREDFRDVTVRRLDARHFIQEDAPAEISEAIEQFLAPRALGTPRGWPLENPGEPSDPSRR